MIYRNMYFIGKIVDFSQIKPTLAKWLHQKANLGLIEYPRASLMVTIGPLDWVNHCEEV